MYGNGLNRATAKAINQQIDKLICDLGDPEPHVNHVVHSEVFSKQFTSSSSDSLFTAIKPIADFRKREPVGEGEIHLLDDNGRARTFVVQLFNNSYQTLVLGRGLKVNSQKPIYIGNV